MSLRVREHAQRVFRHVVQRIGFARRHRISDAGLHVAPPAVISAAESHQMGAPRVIAREPHRLHHGFGAGHVERHFVQPGDLAQAPHIVRYRRMIRAEHRPEVAGLLDGARNALLVEVVAEQVDAVRAGQVVAAIAVEVGDGHAGRRLHEGRGRQMPAHEAAELERHPIGVGELQVRNAVTDRVGQSRGFGIAFREQGGEPHEAGLARRRDVVGRIVGAEEAALVVFVERHQGGDPARHPGMAGERAVLRLRQREAAFQLDQGCGERAGAKSVERESRVVRIHDGES